jgi:prolyl-tRNA synthetase
MPIVQPAELWRESGRWDVMGDNMFRLKDRKGADLCLGMTEEEVMTEIARKELRSYKQLPQIWYQIQPKFRDEPRPKSGLLRVRQFTMKDAYSFDMDAAGLDLSYKKHYDAYCRIFDRCGLKYVAVEAHSGAMGGSQSHEFMVYTDAGEDLVASCPSCGYAANLEKATSRTDFIEDLPPTGDGGPEMIYTPGKGAIADIAEFLHISPKQDIKAVAYMAVVRTSQGTEPEGKNGPLQPVAVFLRGDHTFNEAKLVTLLNNALHDADGASALQISELRPMHPEEVETYFNGPGGFIGPVGLNGTHKAMTGSLTTVLDAALVNRKNMICGANKLDYHYKNVTPGKDFQCSLSADVRNVNEGEGCPNCGTPMKLGKAVEIGHIFKLGYKYSQSMGLRVLDKDGKEVTPIMGSYGIGIERILTSIVEQSHDENGFWMPPNVAPFQVVVSATNVKDEALLNATVDVAQKLEAAGFDVLLDDRDERPGVKFKDADLIGVPFRVTIGKKLSEGKVEVLTRSTRESQDATIAEIVELIRRLVGSAEGKPRHEPS